MANTNQEKPPMVDNNAIFNVFKNEFASTTNMVFVNSLGREIPFREVSVTEQKSLSKTMIENENRKDIVYDTQCALINRLCLEQGFDVYALTEFDRIRILMEIYQNNYYKNEIKWKCQDCGAENVFQLEFGKVVERFNEFDLKDEVFSVEDRLRVYNFTLNYPSVRSVSNFYKSYVKKYKGVGQKEREVLDNLGNIEYINLFIKQIEMINKLDPTNKQVADLKFMSYAQIEQFIALFPQNIIFSDDHGVIKHITTQFIEKINSAFSYEKCPQCGAESTQGMGSVVDFF